MTTMSTNCRKRGSAKDRIRELFLANVGKVLTHREIAQAAGILEYARRIRELRDEEGYRIASYHDDDTLKPGQYRLVDAEPRPTTARTVSSTRRAEVFARDGYTCQRCGAGGGEPDSARPGRRVRLQVHHVTPKERGGTDRLDNLETLCSTCNEGKSNVILASREARNALAVVRAAPRDIQLEVYGFLRRKFEPAAGQEQT